MSLYNIVHGMNPMAHVLLAALGTDANSVPRFRDCWWDGTYIAVHTRTGGGNRDGYECENDGLTLLAGYHHDEDDSFDCTYATFYFTPSPDVSAALAHLQVADATPAQRWESFFARLQSDSTDPQVRRVLESAEPIMQAIAAKVGADNG